MTFHLTVAACLLVVCVAMFAERRTIRSDWLALRVWWRRLVDAHRAEHGAPDAGVALFAPPMPLRLDPPTVPIVVARPWPADTTVRLAVLTNDYVTQTLPLLLARQETSR